MTAGSIAKGPVNLDSEDEDGFWLSCTYSRGIDRSLLRPSTSTQGTAAFAQLEQAGMPPSHLIRLVLQRLQAKRTFLCGVTWSLADPIMNKVRSELDGGRGGDANRDASEHSEKGRITWYEIWYEIFWGIPAVYIRLSLS